MISTIGQLLDTMNVEYQIFDLGRQVQAISKTTFHQVESQATPYPSPHLGKAWLCLVFWAKESSDQPVLWFIQLPLDEQGKLAQAERDRFLQQLLTGAGKNLKAARQGAPFEEVLKNNPFVFTPSPEKQAYVNAKVRQLLSLNESQFKQAALNYLQGDLQQWQELPLQGLADAVCDWRSCRELLTSSIARLPAQPLILLCQLLENEPIDEALSTQLKHRLDATLGSSDALSEQATALAVALLRGLSQSVSLQHRQLALQQCLNSQLRAVPEFLATVASRNHLDLLDENLCLEYLTALAEHDQNVFSKLLQELLFTPIMRRHLLSTLQQQNCPDRVRTAFQAFASSIRGSIH